MLNTLLDVRWSPLTYYDRHCQVMGEPLEDCIQYFIDWETTFDHMPIGDFKVSMLISSQDGFDHLDVLGKFGDLETAKIFIQDHYKSFDITTLLC